MRLHFILNLNVWVLPVKLLLISEARTLHMHISHNRPSLSPTNQKNFT